MQMDHLDPDQWRVLSYLHGQRSHAAPLKLVVKTQDADNDSLFELEGRGLIQATLSGDEIELPIGRSRYAKQIRLKLTLAGRYRCDNSPLPRILRSLNRTKVGHTLTYLLGMALLDDLAEMARAGLIAAADDVGRVDLSCARPVHGLTYRIALVALAGTDIAYPDRIAVQITARGREFVPR